MAVVKLDDVLDQIGFCGSLEIHGWLNRKTGEVYSLSDMDDHFEEDDAEDDVEDNLENLPEWQRADAAKRAEIRRSADWIALPGQFDIDEYRFMRNFILEKTAESVQKDLLQSINGRGAFRYFKDTIHRHGIQDEWFRYRDDRLKQFVKSWLESEEIEYE